MLTFRSLQEYRKTLKKRIKNIVTIQTPRQAAKFLKLKAKQLAPRKTGETIRGIRARKGGNEKTSWRVESVVTPKGNQSFMQNFWANRTPPHHEPRMRWNQGRPTVYGDGSHRNTGVPRFFDVAGNLTQKRYFDLTVTRVHKILKQK
jgi:hypothetical protein